MKVFASSDLPANALAPLRDYCDLDVWEHTHPIPAEQLRSRLDGCFGLLCLLTNRVDAPLLDGLAELQAVSSMSVGVDHIDVDRLTELGIPLGNTPGVLVDATADLTLALMLAAARRIGEADRFVRAGHWNVQRPWHPNMMVGKDLAGATLGVLGLGAIGQAVAQRAAAFGMRVIGWNRTPRKLPGVENVSLDSLIAESDVLSVHVALTDETRMLIDSNAIAAMKSDAIIINTARGGIVDEHALAAALNSGKLFAAGIDVFGQEPVAAGNPLLSLDNVILAPHIGSATEQTRARMAALAVDNMIAALEGRRMPHCANPEVYQQR